MNFSKYTEAHRTITANDIISWEKEYPAVSREITPNTRKHKRIRGTPEDTVYTLKGWMYFVRHETKKDGDGDCDLTIEIGTQSKDDLRVIVEVTNDDCNKQKRIVDYIQSKGFHVGKEFKVGIPCVVRGLGFYDGNHSPEKHGRKGKTNVSSWELHPVIDVKFQ